MPTPDNAVDFILDGRRFFAELKALLDAVRLAPPGAGTYLRMASWSADVTCRVGPTGALTRLVDELDAVAAAGHPVDILLWGPSFLDRTQALGRDVHAQNTAFYDRLNGTQGGRLRVVLEDYGGYVGSATHQKLVIGSVAGQRTVLMGGINLENHYDSNDTHTPLGANFWHDSALRLRGPATTEVEAEWVRRWTKSGLALNANAVAQTQYPAVGGATVNVTIATTNTETSTRVTGIRDELVAAIGRAMTYVYLENYAVCDPAIVTAIRARMLSVPALKVILVSNYDLTGDDYPYRYLMRNTWLKLASVNFRSIDVATVPPPNRQIMRASRPVCSIHEDGDAGGRLRSVAATFSNKWLDGDAIVFRGGGPDETVKFADIVDMDADFRIYAPVVKTGGAPDAVYVHSKLALIDDRILVVGSANWTYRSMVYDGEIAAFIDNAQIASTARAALFDHYNPPGGTITVANWEVTAAANDLALAGGMPVGTHAIVPVPAAAFRRATPTQAGNFTWY